MTVDGGSNPVAPEATTSSAPGARTEARVRVVGAFLFLFALAWWIYQPASKRSFDLVDFPITLPYLQQNESSMDRIAAYTRAGLIEGRFNPVIYAAMDAHWRVFGLSVRGWQLSRFALMCGILLLVYVLLRRLGVTVAGALAGASVYVVAPAATRGWTWLTSAEPLGFLLILVATTIALPSRRHGAASRFQAVAVAVLIAGAVLTKEMLVAACVIPLSALWFSDETVPTGFRSAHRSRLLVAGVTGAIVALIPIVIVFVKAPRGAYAGRFAHSGIRGIDLLGSFWSAFVPIAPHGGSPIAFGLACLLFGVLVTIGWIRFARASTNNQTVGKLAVLAFGVPLAGTLAYAPWPSYTLGYAVPFLFGSSVAVGVALSGFSGLRLRSRGTALTGAALVAVYGISGALTEVRPTQALLTAVRPLLGAVRAQARGDSIVVASNPFQVRVWHAALSFRFSQLARAQGVSWPPARSELCEDAARQARDNPRVLVVRVSWFCPPMPAPLMSIDVPYRLVNWEKPSMETHVVQLQIFRAPPQR